MDEKVLFSAKWITGYSFKDFNRRIGVSRNVLRVKITTTHLSITTNSFLKPFAKLLDIYHIISIESLKSVEKNGWKVFIEFHNKYGEEKKIVLITRKAQKICSILDQLSKKKTVANT